MDASWSETGDRYLLKLFRDYVFHQVNADGSPWIDMAHVVQCLNKVCSSVSVLVTVLAAGSTSRFYQRWFYQRWFLWRVEPSDSFIVCRVV